MKAVVVLGVMAALAAAGTFWVARDGSPDHLLITQAVVKPLDDGSAAAFAQIENTGAPDRLLSISSPSADVILYKPEGSQGLPIMTGVSSLALDGAHIQMSKASASTLQDGSLVPLTLTFEKAGPVNLKARLSDPTKTGNADSVGLFGLGDICIVEGSEPAPAISLSVEKSGSDWTLAIQTDEFEFSKDLLGLYHVPGVGHGHLYVGGMKLERLFKPSANIGALPKGTHEVRVTLNTNDHRAYVVGQTPVSATVMIVVD